MTILRPDLPKDLIAIGTVMLVCWIVINMVAPTPSVPTPSSMVCLIESQSAWHPVTPHNRKAIGRLVEERLAEWKEAETLACYERHPENPRLGELVERRRMEWWRIVK